MVVNKKFQLARTWSNKELKKFAPLFEGSVANISAWKDEDKEGNTYKNYFSNCSEYTITNYKAEARGFQGSKNEIFLDLTAPLPPELKERFDVVFNHTVLEHIFEVHSAIKNLCDMSRDVVMIVVPFLQPMHADYGDYWRFTPTCLHKLFSAHGFKTVYCSFNNDVDASVYVFYVASRQPEKWSEIKGGVLEDGTPNCYAKPFVKDGFEKMVGTNAIINPFFRLNQLINAALTKIKKLTR